MKAIPPISPFRAGSVIGMLARISASALRNPNATHLICWRSMPDDRRNRRKSE